VVVDSCGNRAARFGYFGRWPADWQYGEEVAALKTWSCIICGRVIGEYDLAPGSRIKTVCKRCKAENEIEMQAVEVKRATLTERT
jgi:phage FluMu protein Com